MRRRLLILGAVLVLLASVALGVHLSDRPTPDAEQPDAAALGLLLLDAEDGLLVLAVSDRSTADQAGLEPGDHILRAEGEALDAPQQLNDCLQGARRRLPSPCAAMNRKSNCGCPAGKTCKKRQNAVY